MSDTTSIELRAISKINSSLSYCGHLLPYLQTNDKTRTWDGSVSVYSTPDKKDVNFKASVPVQVKGLSRKNREDLKKNTINYSVKKTKLQNYLTDGGIMYFVVYFYENEYAIYYSSLLPFDLLTLLNNSNETKSCSIPLKKFPENDVQKITNIFLAFVSNYNAQIAHRSSVSLNDLQMQNIEIEDFSFKVTGIGITKNNLFEHIVSHDIYLYAKLKSPKDYDILIPIEKATTSFIENHINKPIGVNGKIYYDTYTVQYSNKGKTIKIGQSFFIKMINQTELKFQYKLSGELKDRLKDVSFLIDMFESRNLFIGQITLPFQAIDIEKDSLSDLKNTYKFLNDIKQLLEQLGIKKDFKITTASDKDYDMINNLIGAVLYHDTLKLNDVQPSTQVFYNVIKCSNISILLLFIKTDNNEYRVENFFKPFSATIAQKDNPQNKVEASQYVLLSKNELLNIDNIDFDAIYNSLINTPPSNYYHQNANLLLLEILNAFDETKSEEFYNLANKLALWLKEESDALEKEITTINYLQIIKRKRKLNIEEQVELFDLSKNTDDPRFLCGIYILLEEYEKAEACFSELTEEIQKEFKTYPIYNLWKPQT